MLEAKKQKIVLNQNIDKKNEKFEVEGDIIVPDIKPDILNTIYSNGTVCIYKKEVLEGKVRIDGAINTYIIYLADSENENIRSLNTTIDFTKIINMEKSNSGMDLDTDVILKDIECKVLNGRKINIKANMEINLKTQLNEEVEILQEINGMQDIRTLNRNYKMNLISTKKQTKVFAKETETIPNTDNLAEIMRADVKIINKDEKRSYNKLLTKADAQVEMMYLTEDNRIQNITATIPVVGFIEIENLKDDNICDVKYEIKNVIIKPNSVQEHSIYIEIELEVSCIVYENREMEIMQDLYSPTEDLKITSKQITATFVKEHIRNVCSIQEKQNIAEVSGNKIYHVEVVPVITNEKALNDKINYEGELQLNFIFESKATNGINTKKIEVPFNYIAEKDGINSDSQCETNLEILKQDFIINTDGTIDLRIDLGINTKILENLELNVIDNVEIDENRTDKISSIVIYFVKPGDTLWKIAKQFKSTVEDIAQINGIENVDNIKPGTLLFIPKYVPEMVSD